MFKKDASVASNGKDPAQQAVESILSAFPEFDGFKLPVPSTDEEVMQNLYNPSWQSQINPKFLEGVQLFKETLQEKLAPKRSFNDEEHVTGEGTYLRFFKLVSQLICNKVGMHE